MDRFDPATQSFTHYRHDEKVPSSLADDHVRAILEDARGRLWVGTLGGLDLLDRETGSFSHLSEALTAADLGDTGVLSLHHDREGVLWVGTRHEGIARWDGRSPSFPHHRVATPEASEEKGGDIVTSFAEDDDGHIFIGTFGAGLTRVDRDARKVVRFRSDPDNPSSLSDDRVMALHSDRRPDNAGGLWLSTNNGLSRFDPENESFTNFDVRHGLQANEFNFGASLRSASGELFFGGINGYNAFFPERMLARTRSAPHASRRLSSWENSPAVPGGR